MCLKSPASPSLKINQRVDGKMLREPARFGQARLEIKMLFRERSAEFARHKNCVACFCT